MNGFSRRIALNQAISYILIVALLVVYFSGIQNNFVNQTSRIVLTVLFLVILTLLLVSGGCSSAIDPVDPIMVAYRNGNKA